MKPVEQANFTPTRGDCFSACVASILEIPLEDVPFFNDPPDASWWDRFKSWLEARELSASYYPDASYVPPGFAIVGGPSPRFPGVLHACVARDGVVVHDPHPSGRGLDVIEDFIVIHGPDRDALWFNGIE